MKLRNEQIIGIIGCASLGVPGLIRELHGVTKVARNAKGEPVLSEAGAPIVELVPYDFAAGVRMKLALVYSKLSPLVEAFEEERKDLARKFKTKAREAKAEGISGELEPSSPVWDDFHKELRALLQTEIEVDRLPTIKEADLKADSNKITQGALAALIPILEVNDA